ncbi:MAG: ATP-grasp domain-containing protein [Thermoleophilaceae bacterium]
MGATAGALEEPRSVATEHPRACVLGDTDLVRPLGLAGIRCAVVTRRDSPKAFSRFVDVRIDWADNWADAEHMRANLLAFAAGQAVAPVLFYQYDGDLLFVSRNREALAGRLRFAIADADLIEQLVDKTRFRELAAERDLPVPATAVVWPGAGAGPPEVPLRFPVVLKPVTRRDATWGPVAGRAKAIVVDSPASLARLWPQLESTDIGMVVQEHVPGGEDRIESYHAYVDERGEVAGEFTGRKIRTLPPQFGFTTACEITDAGDVRELGRHCMNALGLRGVAKVDFKRAPSGELRLLEINPRFNLWHLPGAVAGVNLPALVYADLAGLPRPRAALDRPGVRWSLPWNDLRAARRQGVGLGSWLRWQARVETRHIVAADDPMPFLRGFAWRQLRRRLGRGRG